MYMYMYVCASQGRAIWTGTMRRYSQLTEMLCDTDRLVVKVKVLDEICFGTLEGLACGRLRLSFPNSVSSLPHASAT